MLRRKNIFNPPQFVLFLLMGLFICVWVGGQEAEVATHLSPNELEVTHPRTMGRKAFGRLVQNIKENGINETVKYIEHDGKNYVVDGNHRLVAARALGFDEVPVEKVDLPYLGYKSIEDLDFYSPGFSSK